MSRYYGYRDGSSIAQAIGDYARFTANEEHRRYQRDRQEKLDDFNMSMSLSREQRAINRDEFDRNRLSAIDKQNKTRFEWEEAEHKKALELEAKQDEARGKYAKYAVDLMSTGGAGARGQLSLMENEDSTVTPVINDAASGEARPFTVNPKDNSTTRMRIPVEDVADVQEHVITSAETAAKNELSDDEARAYVRAGLVTDPETGLTRRASRDEFLANLNQQGLLTNKNVLDKLNKDIGSVPVAKDEGQMEVINATRERQFAERSLERELERETPFGETTTDMRKGIDKAGERLSTAQEREAVAHNSTQMPKINRSETLKALGAKVTNEGVKFEDPTDVRKVVATAQELDKAGYTPATSKAHMQIAQEPTVLGQAVRINELAKNKKARAELGAEMYLSKLWDESQVQNFVDTGNPEMSMVEWQEHLDGLETNRAVRQANSYRAKAAQLNALAKAQGEVTKQLEAMAESNDPEKQAKAYKTLQGEVVKTAKAAAGMYFADPKQRAEAQNWAQSLADSYAANDPKYLERAKSPRFVAMMNIAFRSAARAYKKGDKPQSIVPFLTTVEGAMKPIAAKEITAISGQSGLSEATVTDVFNAEHIARLKEYGQLSEEQLQNMFDDIKVYFIKGQ